MRGSKRTIPAGAVGVVEEGMVAALVREHERLARVRVAVAHLQPEHAALPPALPVGQPLNA